jgi:hypothetical protein
MKIINPTQWTRIHVGVCGYNMGFLEVGEFTGVITARVRPELGPRGLTVARVSPTHYGPYEIPRIINLGEAGGMGPHDFRPFIHPEYGLSVIWAYATRRGPRGNVIWGQRYAPLDLLGMRIGEIREIPRPEGVSHKNLIPHGDIIIYHPGRREVMTWEHPDVIVRLAEPLEIDLRGGSVPVRINPQWSLAAFHTTTLVDYRGFVYEAWLGFVDNSGGVHAPIFIDTAKIVEASGLTPKSYNNRHLAQVVFPMGIQCDAHTGDFHVFAGIQDCITVRMTLDGAEILAALAELSAAPMSP